MLVLVLEVKLQKLRYKKYIYRLQSYKQAVSEGFREVTARKEVSLIWWEVNV